MMAGEKTYILCYILHALVYCDVTTRMQGFVCRGVVCRWLTCGHVVWRYVEVLGMDGWHVCVHVHEDKANKESKNYTYLAVQMRWHVCGHIGRVCRWMACGCDCMSMERDK